MAYIRTVDEGAAEGELAKQYKRGANPDGSVDNVLKVHSLHPASLRAHLELYIQSMHMPSPLTRVEREFVGTWVSRLNGCGYCETHHRLGLERVLGGARSEMVSGLERGELVGLSARERAMVVYAERLITRPGDMGRGDVERVRDAGLEDREVLDLAQVVGYFCYANRVVLGLGAELEGADRLGHHPSV